MRLTSRLTCFVLSVLLLLSLCGCGTADSCLIGTWWANAPLPGDPAGAERLKPVSITFDSDGTFTLNRPCGRPFSGHYAVDLQLQIIHLAYEKPVGPKMRRIDWAFSLQGDRLTVTDLNGIPCTWFKEQA